MRCMAVALRPPYSSGQCTAAHRPSLRSRCQAARRWADFSPGDRGVVDQLLAGQERRQVLVEPGPQLVTERLILGGQCEVHDREVSRGEDRRCLSRQGQRPSRREEIGPLRKGPPALGPPDSRSRPPSRLSRRAGVCLHCRQQHRCHSGGGQWISRSMPSSWPCRRWPAGPWARSTATRSGSWPTTRWGSRRSCGSGWSPSAGPGCWSRGRAPDCSRCASSSSRWAGSRCRARSSPPR